MSYQPVILQPSSLKVDNLEKLVDKLVTDRLKNLQTSSSTINAAANTAKSIVESIQTPPNSTLTNIPPTSSSYDLIKSITSSSQTIPVLNTTVLPSSILPSSTYSTNNHITENQTIFIQTDNVFIPKTNLFESNGCFILTLELPGVKRDDILIGLKDNTLSISGQLRSTTENIEGHYRLSERTFGTFKRSIKLSQNYSHLNMNRDQIKATLDDGLLQLIIKKNHNQSII
ncbi:HSP20-like chaperone, partial [Phakopsora pachyrhizi]